MAKSKKTAASDESSPAPKKKAAAPRASKKKAAAAPATPATPAASGAPAINTANAAANAARLLAAKAKGIEPQIQEANKESGGFKQLKQSFNRPAASQTSISLGNALGPAKSNLPFQQHGQKQVAHNQTFGVGRVNVPRRTNG